MRDANLDYEANRWKADTRDDQLFWQALALCGSLALVSLCVMGWIFWRAL